MAATTWVRSKVWIAGNVLTAADLNGEFNIGVTAFNGAFNTTTGHDHDGVNSKTMSYAALVDKPVDRNAFVFSSVGTLTTGNDKNPIWLIVHEACTLKEVFAVLKTAPTGQAVIVDIDVSSDNGSTWTSIWDSGVNRLNVSAGNNAASTVTINNPALAKADVLRMDIDQKGSVVAGSTITVEAIYEVTL